MRLLSPQQLAWQTNGLRNGFYVRSSTAQLIFGGFTKIISYDLRNNLPIMSSFPGITKFSSYAGTLVADGALRDNLTYNQRQLLKWHNHLGHMDFSTFKNSLVWVFPHANYPQCNRRTTPFVRHVNTGNRSNPIILPPPINMLSLFPTTILVTAFPLILFIH